jgi:NTP pyrophosphatase (non-canonical NTP hydrolase)
VLNGCLGLAGEAGETLDMIKKWIFHEKDLDREYLKKELGDVMWYMAMICYSFGFDLDEILQMNIDKLKARYPEGFDTERANHRAEGDI